MSRVIMAKKQVEEEVEVEEMDEEIVDDEEVDDEEYEDEGEEADDESDEEEIDEVDEDFELKFSDGSKMTASEVAAMRNEYESLKAKEAEYNKLVDVVNQYEGELSKHELLRDAIYYLREGKYSPQQILEGMLQLEGKSYSKNAKKTFETIEEEVDYRVEAKTKKLEAELAQLKQHQLSQQIRPYNIEILWNNAEGSISDKEYSSPEFTKLMREANDKFNDGANLHESLLDKRTAAAIVNYALARYKRQPMKKKVVASSKAATELPKRIPSNAGGKGTSKGSGDKNISRAQKISEWNSL